MLVDAAVDVPRVPCRAARFMTCEAAESQYVLER